MKWITKTLGAVFGAVLCGIAGVTVGGSIGGNSDLVVLGQRGYEGLGFLGLIVGAVVGAILGLLVKPSKKRK